MRTVYSHYPRMLGLPPLVASTAEKCRRNWFLLCIVVAIMFAKTAPWIGTKGGPLRPEYTVKYGAVFFIFLNSGLSIRTEEFSKALFQLEIHAFVQLFTLGFVPIFVKVCTRFALKSVLKYIFKNIRNKIVHKCCLRVSLEC